jgi:hypothetical protein
MKKRLYDLMYKLFGIKGFIWMVGTALLIAGPLDSDSWMLLSVGVGGMNVAQKVWVKK